MRNNNYNDLRYAGHLRRTLDRPLYLARIVIYVLLALTGVLMTILTNGDGIKYDSESGEVYKHAYRVQVYNDIEYKEDDDYEILDFTKPLASLAPLGEYDYDNALLLGRELATNEIVVATNKRDKVVPSSMSLYQPSSGLTNFTVTEVLYFESLYKDTIFLNPTVYHQYNCAYEGLANITLESNNINISGINPLTDMDGILSSEQLEADIYLSITDRSLDSIIGDINHVVGYEKEINVRLSGTYFKLKVRFVEGPTTFNYMTFFLYGNMVVHGKTILYENLKDAFRSRQSLLNYEDKYYDFNNIFLTGDTYESTYTIAAISLVAIYALLIISIFISSYKSRNDISKLAKLGFPRSLSLRHYALNTYILSFISLAISGVIFAGLVSFLRRYGSLLWFNAFDIILVILIEILIASLDVFVVTRRRL